MAPTSRILLCRHSQAEHNVDLDYSIPDAPLTALGKKQSAALQKQIAGLYDSVDVVVSSPLRRTLQSTKLGWGPAVERLGGISKVVCLPQAQECNDFPCDTGSPRQELESLDEFKGFNLELLTPDWTSKQGFYAPDRATIAKRAQWVRQFLRGRPEHTIVLVAHGDILRQITSTAEGPSTYQWKNAEVREFRFNKAWVDKDECFLEQEHDIAAAGGYEATSTEMDL
ncbi:phosphoglycerate mutase-like protein [Acaromyces ingoldii]|uniref:Phosphoglycerate mutase-like protein n=1 Tax=Acaromyces ingoldii TaxID=215250 RepID=A0A316YJX1_9BASI|nr:phosphoglycerate mutase-like protein [Acaromyces ingoldii]PWN89482.1 phosphoglycerate mutase-like protein [Acaromyces ingoldii]